MRELITKLQRQISYYELEQNEFYRISAEIYDDDIWSDNEIEEVVSYVIEELYKLEETQGIKLTIDIMENERVLERVLEFTHDDLVDYKIYKGELE